MVFILLLLVPMVAATSIPPGLDEEGNVDLVDPTIDVNCGFTGGGAGGVPDCEHYTKEDECPVVFHTEGGKRKPVLAEVDDSGRLQAGSGMLELSKIEDFKQQGGACGDEFRRKRPQRPANPKMERWHQGPSMRRKVANAENLGVGVRVNDKGIVEPIDPALKNEPLKLPEPKMVINMITGDATYELDFEQKELKVLVIPVQFTDVQGKVSVEELDQIFFGEGGLSEYFEKESYGALKLTGDVAPQWYTLSNTMGYYGGNYETNVGQMIEEAVQVSDATVDYSQYDSDGDGLVDSFFVVHAGEPDEAGGGNGDEIWSHYFSIDGEVADGVEVIDYETVSEESPLGIIAHEFGHYLGLPDMYDTVVDDGSSKGTGEWSIMGYGGYMDEPGAFDPWSKAYMGWLNEDHYQEISVTDYYDVILDNEEFGVKYYLLALSEDEEFFIENRHEIELMNGDDASGMVIWHIDKTVMEETGTWNGCSGTRWECNVVNGDASHKLVDVEEASGSQDLDDGDLGEKEDLWYSECGTFGGCQQYVFSSSSTPSSESYTSSENDVVIAAYSERGSTMQLAASLEGTLLEEVVTAVEAGDESTASAAVTTTTESSDDSEIIIILLIILIGLVILAGSGVLAYKLLVKD